MQPVHIFLLTIFPSFTEAQHHQNTVQDKAPTNWNHTEENTLLSQLWRRMCFHSCQGIHCYRPTYGWRRRAMLWTSRTSHHLWLFSRGGDYCLACQPPILPSSRQTKGMDGSQTECLNLACIKGLNRKLPSTRENFNELHNSQILKKTTWDGP